VEKYEFSWLDLAVAKQAFINEMKVDYTKQFDGTTVKIVGMVKPL
jgi:hypothetical protein